MFITCTAVMGGMCTVVEVRGYLEGTAILPRLQRDLVFHVINESLNDPYPHFSGLRAPCSNGSVAAAAGYSRSAFDGGALEAHRWRRKADNGSARCAYSTIPSAVDRTLVGYFTDLHARPTHPLLRPCSRSADLVHRTPYGH